MNFEFDPLAIHQQDIYSVGENRFIAIGMDNMEQLLVVVYTVRLSV